ncbi:thiol:disulfide interchange protein DsbA/DsbL [Ferrimonas pelagia]|uniref:Thiol:disulfide interchange protein DsbA n=1 Tax=Ferrimonas pelagia TaxID=1177826 RepID=A0ABP9FDL0_9GAMM
MKKTIALCSVLVAALLGGCSDKPEEVVAPAPAAATVVEQTNPTEISDGLFVEGHHYFLVNPQGTSDGPVVTEFFSLYCGGCYNMEARFLPMIVPVLDSQGIQFEQKHVNFAGDQTGEDVVRGFAILQNIGDEAQQKALKETLFEELGGKDHDHSAHGHDHEEGIQSLADLRPFFVAAGIDGAAFDAAAQSNAVNADVSAWAEEQQMYQVASVPSFIVNNRYQINMREIATLEELTDLMSYLSSK